MGIGSCLCQSQTQHRRATHAIDVDEYSINDLTEYFCEANVFIAKAKANEKCVLIHSYKGTNRAMVFAIQYLMQQRKCGIEQAKQLLINEDSGIAEIKITQNFYASLRKWESQLANKKSSGEIPNFTVSQQSSNVNINNGFATSNTMISNNRSLISIARKAWM